MSGQGSGRYILFDIPDGVDPDGQEFLEQLGHPVKVCHGPKHGQLCPILSGTGCPLAEGAEGIVFELDLDRPQHRAILRTYKDYLRSDLPIGVSVRPGQETAHSELLKGLTVWTHTPVAGDLDGLVAEVETATG